MPSFCGSWGSRADAPAMTIAAILARYGLIAIFVGAGVEGETVVVTGGVMAHQGLVPLAGAMAAAVLGSFAADQLLFLTGRRFRDHPRVVGWMRRPAFARALAAFALIRSYSPYDNVVAQDYPPLFISGGLNDPRVTYWEPAKWAAKLRSHKTDDNLLLLKTNMGAGHGGKSGRFESLREVAEEHAFVLWQLGIEG